MSFDPFAEENAVPEERTWRNFVGIEIDGYEGVFVTGVGIERFDASVHGNDARRSGIYEVNFFMVGSGNAPYPIKCPAYSKQWKLFFESLAVAMGHDLTEANSRTEFMTKFRNMFQNSGTAWAETESIKTGETYTSRKTGEKKDKYTQKVLRFFANEAECLAAHDEHFEVDSDATQGGDSPVSDDVMNYLRTIPAVAKIRLMKDDGSGVDPVKTQEFLKADSVLNIFDHDSREVVKAIRTVDKDYMPNIDLSIKEDDEIPF